MEQNIFEEYERILKQKEEVLKQLEQKRADQARYYEDAIEATKLHYGATLSDLHSRCLKELDLQFRGNFDISLSRLKKHLVGKDGNVSFAIYCSLPHLTKSSGYMEMLRNKMLWIKFYRKDQTGCPPSFSISFNPDQILTNGKKLDSMISYKQWGGDIVPIISFETENLLTIKSKDVQAFAMREMSYKEYKNVKAIMDAVREEKEIQSGISKIEEEKTK